MGRTILVVDDSSINRQILRKLLSADYAVLEAEDGRQAIDVLRERADSISAVLLDLEMPELDGFGVLAQMRRVPELAAIPVIVTTGNTDGGAEIQALSLGANDFVTKPYNAEVIRHRLWNTINLRETAAFVNAATRDKLTGLYNREAFFEKASELIATQEPGYYVLSCLDIDNFKVINDQFGSSLGDEVLRYVAGVLEHGFGALGGISSRITADNFAVLYPRRFMDLPEVAEIYRQAAATDGALPTVTISIGLYVVKDTGLSISAMYDRAVIAETSVKGRFDAHIALYDESMREQILQEQEIINEMNTALAEGQFEPWFQPQFNHSSGALIGAEALVRWRHPQKGLIFPGTFIPVFERNGFIYELDKYIWEQVCILLRRWLDEGRLPLPVSVNISRYDMFRDDFYETLTGLVHTYSLPIDLLRLEITESAFTDSTEHIIGAVKRLIAFGFTVEIDDFGSGYSSLNTLKDVPASILKLDMRFLESSENSQRGGNILESIVRMAKWLCMPVIAEGVETKEQADYLKTIGCSYVQGYLYARPMPVEEYEQLAAHCGKEKKMVALETVDKLDNNAFWDPKSMETLIFNSYVGGACIFEYYGGKIELLRINEKYAQELGGENFSMEEALTVDLGEHMDEENLKLLYDCIRHAVATGDESSCETRLTGLPARHGSTYLRAALRVIAEAGDHALLYCSVADVTEQRLAEQKVLETAAQIQAILKNVNGGVSAATLTDGVIDYIFVNDEYYAMFGYTREQFEQELPRGLVDLIDPADLPHVYDSAYANEKTGEPVKIEYRAHRRDGSRIWVRSNSSTCYIDGVEQPVHIAVTNDVTGERESQQQILESSEQLRFLNTISRNLLTDGNSDDAIRDVIAQILEYFHGDRAYVFELNDERQTVNNTYEVCAPDALSMLDFCQNIPFATIAFWLEAFARDNYVSISDVDTLDQSRAAEQELLLRQGIRSMVAVPLRRDGKLIGFMGVDDPREKQSHVDHLAALGDYMAVILTRRDLNAKIRSDSEMLENLMNDTPGGFARLKLLPDDRYGLLYANEGYCALVGMDREELMALYGSDSLAGVHPDDREVVLQAAEEMQRNGGRLNAQYRLRHGDGGYVWTRVFGRLTRNESGEHFLNIYYTDLSDQEKQALSFQEMLPVALAAMMESSTELSFVKDKDLTYMCCSRAFAAMVGLENEKDIAGKTDYDLFGAELAEQYRADDRKLMASGNSLVDYVEQLPAEDGVVRYSCTSKYLLHDSFDNIIGIYGTGRDITESRTTDARLKLFIDSPPCGIAMFELQPDRMRTLYFSDGFYNFSGYSREEYLELIAEQPLHLVLAEDLPAVRAALTALLRDDTPLDCSYRCRTKDGGHRWFNMRGSVTERYGDAAVVNAVQFDISEQKAAEDAIRVHEQEMKLAMSQMGKMICEYDPIRRTLTMPEAYAKQYDAPMVLADVPQSVEQMDVIDDSAKTPYTDFYEAIQRGEKTGSAELYVRRANGEYHWEHAEFSTIFDANGKPVKAIIAIEDTTQQHLQYELEQSKPSLGEDNLLVHALFNLSTGETLDYAYCDGSEVPPEARSAFGSGRDNLDVLLIDEDERQRYRALNDADSLLEHYAQGETEFSIDYRRRVRGGEPIWVRNILHLVRDPGGSDILLFEYCYNIEEEKLQELMYHSLANDNYDYVARIDGKSGRFITLPRVGLTHNMPPLQGENADDVAALMATRHVHPDDREMTLRNTGLEGIKHNLESHERFQFTCRELEEDGSVRHKKFTSYYLDRAREIIIVTREDITLLMQEEAEKNKILADALEAANQASRAKTLFLSRMSHELRTPMNAIIGLSALAAGDIGDRNAMEDTIGKIGMSARYLLSLINDILEMSRIESGRMTLNEEPFDFEQLISSVNSIVFGQASAKGVDYDAVVNSYMEPIYVGDSTKLQQILINVLGNAVKFTPSGGKVTLAMEQLRRSNDRVTLRFVINDTGIGIDKEFLPHLFDSFAQETAGLTASSSGTGLGLAITKHLVDMMNGQISVQSIKNVGSVFTIDVQLGISEESRHYLDMVAGMNLSKLRALVVDDDVIVCQSTESILSAIGMQAEWVDSGLRAVERVKQVHAERQDFDTIFIDWKMPDMDGIETTRQIRRIVGPEVTIIIMTAYDWRSVETQAMEAGVDMFMEKPLFQSSIVKAFEKVFSSHRLKLEEPAEVKYDLSGKRLLLAEDHPLNVEVAKRLLQSIGAEVVVVNNGLEALETFTTAEDHYFDAILMDIRMPVMDGLTATRNIRNLKKSGSRRIPIIAMTANAFDEDVELSLTNGMDAHLAKPVDPRVLFSTLQRLIGDRE